MQAGMPPDRAAVRALVAALRGPELPRLCAAADAVRRAQVGDEVYLRGIIECSNHCRCRCAYCGISAGVSGLVRYRLTDDEILAAARGAVAGGMTTVVLQSGEDPTFDADRLGALIRRIKTEVGVAVTLSVGERTPAEYRHWRDCGMDRYLLRFETSNPSLFAQLHPDSTLAARLDCLRVLRELGVQIGAGFMVGLPGATDEDLVNDLELCRALDPDMIGIGPFIPHPGTALAASPPPVTIDYMLGVVALLRMTCPEANIPATTALDALAPDGRQRALQCGANVFMPNVTPAAYRARYQLYPGKPCIDESGDDCARCVRLRLQQLGRPVGTGPGHSLRSVKISS